MGAFIPGYPIQPVVVRYPYVHFDQSWGNISLMKLMFRMFTQFHNFMEVEYLPVVSPSHSQKEPASIFAERTARAIASTLNVVQTSYSYGDMMLLMKAHEMKQENPSRFMVELTHKDLDYRINTVEALEFLDKFLSMDPDNSGNVKFEDFLRALRLKPCDLTRKIFDFVDFERNEKITFKQFLLASTHVMRQPLFQHACEFSFAMCHDGAQNYVSMKEFADTNRQVMPFTNDEDVAELFNMFDKDGDGKITKPDFLNCLTKNPLLIAIFAHLLPYDFVHVRNGLPEDSTHLFC